MRITATTLLILAALCCQCAQVSAHPQEIFQGHARSIKFLGRLFGGGKDEEESSSASSSSSSSVVSSSASSSSVVSSGSSSTSTTSTSLSSDDVCGRTTTTSISSGNAQSSGSAIVSGVDCGAKSDSEAISKGEETTIAAAEAVAEKGKYAQAIAKSIGSGDGVDVLSTAIAEAVEVGEGDAVALAIAASLKPDCKRSFLGRDCPDDIAQDAIVKAYAQAENSGSGSSYAEALAYGLVYDSSKVQLIFVKAVSRILKDNGCSVTKPLIADARAFAINLDKDVEFLTSLDADIKISKCLFETCTGSRLKCCTSSEDTCVCTEKKACNLDLIKDNPKKIWSSPTEACICP